MPTVEAGKRGIQSPDHPGRQAKQCWLRAHFGFGPWAKILTGPDGEPCGYIAKFAAEIARTAEEEHGLRPKIVRLASSGDAQDAPMP